MQIYLVMELVNGISLLSYLKSLPKRKASQANAVYIFKQLTQAVEYCHSKSICHRDIKLENIIIDESMNLKLIDFGFAAIVSKPKYLNFFCGTPSYMPPEIVLKKEYLGFNADVWCLGILLYTLLCGSFPFRGKSEKELYIKITKGEYLKPDYLLSSDIDLLNCILRAKPEDRPTCGEVS